MAKAGDKFEEQVKWLYDLLSAQEGYTSVEGPKVKIPSPDGEREFDVVLKVKACGIEFLTVIECRDYKSRLDVTHIDGFQSKIEDVNASKGIIISRNGFTGTAIKKAKRFGVKIYTFSSIVKKPELIKSCGHPLVFLGHVHEFNFQSHYAFKNYGSFLTLNDDYNKKCFDEVMSNPEFSRNIYEAAFESFFGSVPDFEKIIKDAINSRKISISKNIKIQELELTPTKNPPYLIGFDKFPSFFIEIEKPLLRIMLNDVECFVGDPLISDDHLSLYENVDPETLSHVATVSENSTPLERFVDILEACDEEPEEIPKNGLIRITYIKTIPNRRIFHNQHMAPLSSNPKEFGALLYKTKRQAHTEKQKKTIGGIASTLTQYKKTDGR